MQNIQHKKYFFGIILIVIFGILTVGCINYFVDPLGVNDSPRRKKKTSRIEGGMNSQSHYLDKSRIFNAGISGSNIE